MNRGPNFLTLAAALSLGVLTLSALAGPASAVRTRVRPDMACIVKTAAPQTLDQGVPSNILYEVTVQSVGTATVNDVVVTDVLPADVSFVSASAGCVHAAGTVTCDLGSVGAGVVAMIEILVDAADPQPGDDLTNVASVSSSNDVNSSNNGGPGSACEVAVEVQPQGDADMECVVKTADSQLLSEGVPQDISYEVTVRNAGDATAEDVSITDVLPTDVSFVSASAGCVHAAGTVTCDLGSVGAGVVAMVDIVVEAANPLPGDDLTNVASVSASNDSSSGNNGGPGSACEVSAEVRPQGEADMECVVKTGDPQLLSQGLSQDITYEVTVRNAGDATAEDVSITDVLPTDVSFVSAPGCVHLAGTVTCDLGSVDAGAVVQQGIVVNAADPQPGDDLTNVASVSASNDQSAGNNGGPGSSCEVSATVVEQPDGDEGCTPGYWKNHHESWVGFAPEDWLDELFMTSGQSGPLKFLDGDLDDDGWRDTLDDALAFGGGCGPDEKCTKNGAGQILTRAAVAAVLNASNPAVAYPRSVADIVDDVDAALDTGNRNIMLALAAALDSDNNLGCPLN